MTNDVRGYTESWLDENINFRVSKSQNKCWYRIGSPPIAGSKNDVFRLRSVSSIVIAPARTGSDARNSVAP